MSENDSLQEPYLATLDLNISEHLKLYNKEITGISESNRYDPQGPSGKTSIKN